MARPRRSFDQIVAARPAIRVNQLGYLPGRPMVATLVCASAQPVDFVVRDRHGTHVLAGRSQPWPRRPEPTSGLSVHQLDFTGLRAAGAGLHLRAAGQRSHPFAVSDGLYGALSVDALNFFTLMRSGTPILASGFPRYARPAGHLGRAPNRGDVEVSAWTGPDAERLYPGWSCEGTFDVSGGWYDAGDYGKYVTSGGIATWQLLSTLELLRSAQARPSSPELAGAVGAECR